MTVPDWQKIWQCAEKINFIGADVRAAIGRPYVVCRFIGYFWIYAENDRIYQFYYPKFSGAQCVALQFLTIRTWNIGFFDSLTDLRFLTIHPDGLFDFDPQESWIFE